MGNDADKPVPPNEADVVTRLLTAYTQALAKDLREACPSGRVFLIITSPVARGGQLHIAGNLAEHCYESFLQHVLDSSTGRTAPVATFRFAAED